MFKNSQNSDKTEARATCSIPKILEEQISGIITNPQTMYQSRMRPNYSSKNNGHNSDAREDAAVWHFLFILFEDTTEFGTLESCAFRS